MILPADNEPDVRYLPDYRQHKLNLIYVRDIQEVLAEALVKE